MDENNFPEIIAKVYSYFDSQYNHFPPIVL